MLTNTMQARVHMPSHFRWLFFNPRDWSPSGSSVQGILQGRRLHPPGDLPSPGNQTRVSESPELAGGFFTAESSEKPRRGTVFLTCLHLLYKHMLISSYILAACFSCSCQQSGSLLRKRPPPCLPHTWSQPWGGDCPWFLSFLRFGFFFFFFF